MHHRNSERGFSLVETLIAMAILGTVLISILTLFVLGRKNVYSGKQMSQAVAVGTRVLEDLSPMTIQSVMTNFGFTDATALTTNGVGGVSYPNSAVVTTVGATTGYLGRWAQLVPTSVMTNGKVSLVAIPTDPTNAGAKWSTAQYMQIIVVVEWFETGRDRTAVFRTAKVQRGLE